MSWRNKYHGQRLRRQAEIAARLQHSFTLRFVDGLATTTMAFVVPLMVYTITHNIAWSGASFTLEWLPRLMAIPIAGPFVDRLGATRFFVIADSMRAVVLAGAAIVLFNNPRAWVVVVATAIITGMLAQSTFVAAEKLGVEVTGTRSLHYVQAVQVGIDQVVQVLGPIVGGALLIINGAAALIAISILLVVSIYLAWRLERTMDSPISNTRQSSRILTGFRLGLSVISRRRSLIHVIIGTALFNLLLALLLTITPAVVEQRFHQGTASVSIVWSLAATTSVIAVCVASRVAKRFGITAIGFVSGMIACIACLVAGLTNNYWVYVGCVMIFLAMDACYAVFIRTARARMVPKAVYGTTLGVIVLLNLAPYPVAGVLVAAVPFHLIPELITACTILTAALSCWSFTAMDHRALNTETATVGQLPAYGENS
jgi:MFS family permease